VCIPVDADKDSREGEEMKRAKKLLAIGLLMALIPACATIDSIQRGEGRSFHVHDRTYDQVWMAGVTVASKNLTIVERDKEAGVIKAEKGFGLWTSGQVVGIFISPASQESALYTVEVVSKERYKFQIGAKNWEQTLIDGMKTELATSDY
jgi:hypothetical protein